MENVRELQPVGGSISIIDDIDVTAIQGTMRKITQLQVAVQSTLKKDHDFGVIPGTFKPTLLKPGAEKILMMFGLTSEYEFLEKVENYEKGFFAYTLKCKLLKKGQKITEGVGQCNTMEGKYRYRWVSEKNVPEGIAKETLPSRNKEGKYGPYTEYKIENDDPYTLANTVLKMAKKRAQVDAVLTVASLSEVFTQDIEDMREFIQQEQMDNMDVTDAKNLKITFGSKHKGKTLGEIYKSDIGYVKWLSHKASDAVVRKAATELLMEKENEGEKTVQDGDDHPF
ncbi:MAG: hypothetical protein N4A57_02580 [Anaeromicrobium sp.]|jgi:hypothetical protein|uniref:hypothetical protein n=1 Tax=Anaeromicrobium sp. TaxID=1929132 RepID=UPI0025F12257|nr:hypothetical protein [Anaeromicrobium sp.]MCT4593146.1 hypothetical protein [Anaeromicrobium sp.]